MRKIYSIIVAMVVIMATTFSADAAKGLRAAKSIDMSAMKSLNTKLPKAEKSGRFASKKIHKTEGDTALDEILGSYYSLYYYYDEDYEDWTTYITSMEITSGENDNEVIISGFWDADYEVKGIYDSEMQTITIPKQVFDTSWGYDMVVECYDLDDEGNVTLLDQDMVLYYDPSDNSLMSIDYWGITMYEEGAELIEDNCEYMLDYCMMMVCAPTNGTATYTITDDEDGDYEYSDNVACTLEDSVLSVENFGGMGMIVKFNIDSEAKTATASSQYLAYAEDSAGNMYPYFMVNADGEGEVVGTISGDKANEIHIDEWYILFNDNMYGPYTDTVIVTPFELADNSGVASVAIDSEAAPVYYNMQGAKISNPEKGIYVKVVGNKATKVVVK